MLRKFLFLLALLVLVGIALVGTGIVEVPKFGQVRINPVEVGTETRKVEVETPTIRVKTGNEAAAPAPAPTAPSPPTPPANGQ